MKRRSTVASELSFARATFGAGADLEQSRGNMRYLVRLPGGQIVARGRTLVELRDAMVAGASLALAAGAKKK